MSRLVILWWIAAQSVIVLVIYVFVRGVGTPEWAAVPTTYWIMHLTMYYLMKDLV